jgi:hypothetical protein
MAEGMRRIVVGGYWFRWRFDDVLVVLLTVAARNCSSIGVGRTGWSRMGRRRTTSVGSTLIFVVHRFARFLSNGDGGSIPRRGEVNKRYLVKLDKQERNELSQLVKTERIAAKKRTHAQALLLADEGKHGPRWKDSAIAEHAA